MTDGEQDDGPGPVPVPPTPKLDVGEDVPHPLSHGGVTKMCHFCHELYQGTPRECPHCGRMIPKIPTG